MTPADARRIAEDIRSICAPNNVPPDIEEFLRVAVAAYEGRPRIVMTPVSRNDDEACREAFDRAFDAAVAKAERYADMPSYETTFIDNPGWARGVSDCFLFCYLCELGFGSTMDLSDEGARNRERLFVDVTRIDANAVELYACWRWRNDVPRYERRAKIQRRA